MYQTETVSSKTWLATGEQPIAVENSVATLNLRGGSPSVENLFDTLRRVSVRFPIVGVETEQSQLAEELRIWDGLSDEALFRCEHGLA